MPSNHQIPRYIENRIRQPHPVDSCVVPGSTAVVSFGNAQISSVATLGLNPSRVEFIDRDGKMLTGNSRRLSTHESLGTSDLTNASTDIINRVFDECNQYFQRNPYRRWFDQFLPVLKALGVSYYDGTACHLDLVQWATDPTWAGLKPVEIRLKLLRDDVQFFRQQLEQESLKLLLVNGQSVVSQLKKSGVCDIEEIEAIAGFGNYDTKMYAGTAFGRVAIVGWSTNLQSSFGVSRQLREELARRVKDATMQLGIFEI
jgi:hypothetical protein